MQSDDDTDSGILVSGKLAFVDSLLVLIQVGGTKSWLISNGHSFSKFQETGATDSSATVEEMQQQATKLGPSKKWLEKSHVMENDPN